MSSPSSNPSESPGIPAFQRFERNRLTILRASGTRWHRYRLIRFLTMAGTVLLLFVAPLFGLARFDLFAGAHRAMGAPAAPLYAFVAVAVAIFAFYFLTFQVNLVAGRLFCGFGCPVGQLNRLTDTFRASKSKKARLMWGSVLVAFAGLLSIALLTWWSSPGGLLEPTNALIASGAVVLTSAGAIVFARSVGWSFCMKACPIGLYYSVVQQKRPLGILFDVEHCQDEIACVKACPVHLDPRDMLAARNDIGGFALEGLASTNHCLRCGACVEACELVTSKISPPALTFGRPTAGGPSHNVGTNAFVPLGALRTAAAAQPSTTRIQAATVADTGTAAVQPSTTRIQVASAPHATPARARPPTAWVAGVAAGLAVVLAVTVVMTGQLGADASTAVMTTAPEPPHRTQRSVAHADGAHTNVEVVLGPDGFSAPAFEATWGDQLRVENVSRTLHTLVIRAAGRDVRNTPIPPGLEPRSIPLPPPGEYDLGCGAHPDEHARLIVHARAPSETDAPAKAGAAP